MESESFPKDVIVLEAIKKGAKKFNKIEKVTKIQGNEINDLLIGLDKRGFIKLIDKKGFFRPKKEIALTEKGNRELEERRFELQQNWNKMVTAWKNGNKQELERYVEDNKSILSSLMFLGIMDFVMFSTMMSFMDLAMSSYMQPEMIPDQAGSVDSSFDSGDAGSGMGDGGDFNIDIGF